MMGLPQMEKQDRLETCRKIRNIAAQTCLYVFQHVFKASHKVSEVNFKNQWLKELERSYFKGFIGCWYDPPPGGIAVLFGDENNYERVNYPSLRSDIYWPRPNVFFKKDGLGYVFASPYTMVDNLPIIGDFGFTFYLGDLKVIKDHYRKCYKVLEKLIDKIEIGKKFKDLYKQSIRIIKDHKLENLILGTTDKAKTDLGHTIPFIDRNPDEKEMEKIDSGKAEQINGAISQARVFCNEFEEYVITDNCAFTFEPRFISQTGKLPMFSFHTIVQFMNGKKVVLSNFDGIFNLLGMNWLKN
jgi:hypothetical protein